MYNTQRLRCRNCSSICSCILLFILLVAPAAAQQTSTDVSITDDAGRTITLAAPAKRIIALYGAFNEILASMELEDRIIARTKADTLPPSILSKPSIGTHMRPNPELVAGLAPDLVLQMGGRKKAMDSVTVLEQLNIPVAFFTVSNFAELFSVIERIGILTGQEEAAAARILSMQKRLDEVTRIVAHATRRPTVFFEVRYPNLLGAGQGSIVNDIIAHAGGSNILDMPQKLVRLNEEELIQRNPQWYLIQQGAMNPSPVPLQDRPHFATLQALMHQHVRIIDEQKYSRPGPRAVSAVEELARMLHPQLFTAEREGENTK